MRIQSDNKNDNDPDGLNDPPLSSSEDDDENGVYDENGRPKLISMDNPRYQHKQQSSTNKVGDNTESSSKKRNVQNPRHNQRK